MLSVNQAEDQPTHDGASTTQKSEVQGFLVSKCQRASLVIFLTFAGLLAYHEIVVRGEFSKKKDSMVVRRERVLGVTQADRFFIDIASTREGEVNGAVSQSLHLEKKNWPGICAFPLASEDVMARRTCNLVRRPVSNVTGTVIDMADCTQIVNKVMHAIKSFLGMDTHHCVLSESTTISITDLLTTYGAPQVIDYVAMTLQGAELDVLKSFPFGKFCVRSWSIDSIDNMPAIKKYLEESHGCHVRNANQDVSFARCPCELNSAASTHSYVIPAGGMDRGAVAAQGSSDHQDHGAPPQGGTQGGSQGQEDDEIISVKMAPGEVVSA